MCAQTHTHTHGMYESQESNPKCSHHKKMVFPFPFIVFFSISHIFIFIVYEMMDAKCTYFGNHFIIYMSIHYAVFWWLPNFLTLGTSSGEANFFLHGLAGE